MIKNKSKSLYEVSDEILAQADIVQVIKNYLPDVTGNNNTYYVKCPFHNDSDPSLTISVKKGIAKCFVCNTKAMNAITFVRNYLNIPYIKALSHVAKLINYDISSFNWNKPKNSKETTILKINQLALNLFKDTLEIIIREDKINPTLLKICNNIGYQKIKEFQLGFCQKSLINHYFQIILNAGFSAEDILASEIFTLNNDRGDNKNYFSLFENRVIFPILNAEKEVVAFNARTLSSTSKSKYINSKESIVFKKSNCLFNIANINLINCSSKEVYIVEGIKDVIALSNIEYKNAVGTLGTLLHQEQISQLKNLIETMIFVPDQDEAGLKSVIQNAALALKNDFKVKIVSSLSCKDVADVLEAEGKTTLKSQLMNQINWFDFVFQFLTRKYNLKDNEEKLQFCNEFLGYIYLIDSPLNKVRLELYFSKLAEILELNKNIIEDTFIKIKETQDQKQQIIKQIKNKFQQTNQQVEVAKKYTKYSLNNLWHLLVIQALHLKNALDILDDREANYLEPKTKCRLNDPCVINLLTLIHNYYNFHNKTNSILAEKNEVAIFINFIQASKFNEEQKEDMVALLNELTTKGLTEIVNQSFNVNYTNNIIDKIWIKYLSTELNILENTGNNTSYEEVDKLKSELKKFDWIY